jgi:hypothetical protein
MDEKLINFLARARHANWRQPPKVWNEQLRQALSEGLVTVGWGGVIKVTDTGWDAVKAAAETNGHGETP